MIRIMLMRWLGRWISRMLLGPVHVYGAALKDPAQDPDIILVSRTLGPADCWLFWGRLARPPVFWERGQFSECWGYRWLSSRPAPGAPDDRPLADRLRAWLDAGRCVVMSIDIQSPSARARLETDLTALQTQRSVALQLLTFNYDFRHTLGSPVHWIWRPETLRLASTPLNITRELQALEKHAWRIKGYQTLPQFPLVTRPGRVPSTLLLSWHEVRARRRWRWPRPVIWLWLPLAVLTALLNLAPLLAAYLLGHGQTGWRIEVQTVWLGPLFTLNHLLLGLTTWLVLGPWGLCYLPLALLGVHPVGQLADGLIDLEDTPDTRSVRERMLNYFD